MAGGLPFTSAQFFQIFVVYNEALWPAVVAWWLVTLAFVVAAWRNPAASRWLMWVLGLCWAWNALVYHAWLFTAINPAAWGFAGLFLVQAGLLLAATRRVRPFFTQGGWTGFAGCALTAYAFLYPFLTLASGHRFPAAPSFGVPCPTVILTIGLLLTTSRLPLLLAIVPVLWALVGGSAAYLLRVPTDYVLLGAGILFAWTVLHRCYLPSVTRTSPQ